MTYQDFINTIQIEIPNLFSDDNIQFKMQTIKKNNGVEYDALIIISPNLNISPTIYMNPYYHRYLDGVSISEILDDIVSDYYKYLPDSDFDITLFTNYNRVKDNIIMKLIHYNKNEKLLETIPHFRYLDFAIVFQCYLQSEKSNHATILIHNEHLDYWNITKDDLYSLALRNTPNLFPSQMESLLDIFKASYPDADTLGLAQEFPMYVLTNHQKLNGATCILYQGLLTEIANKFNQDFILLPSSVHEVILIPFQTLTQSAYDLKEMICEINDTQVMDNEVLSDHPYIFYREKNILEIFE